MTAGALLVVGSANLDCVVRAPHVPAPGETVLGHDLQTFPGGKGANQAVAAARAGGADTRMLLALGQDAAAQRLEQSLRAAGVQLHVQRVLDQPTGTAFITVADNGENAITVAPGANDRLDAAQLPPLLGIGSMLLQLETPLAAVVACAQAAHAAGVSVLLNAAPAPAQALPQALLDLLDVLVVNEGELAALVGEEGGLDERLQRLRVGAVVVTLGARGCVARTPQGRWHQPALPLTVLDTTAAGDTFCGVLAAALARAADWPQALQEATAAAALACTRAGAQSSVPARAEVLALLQQGDPARPG